jgi:hypothetical protein
MVNKNQHVKLMLGLMMICSITLWPSKSFALGDYNDIHRKAIISFASEQQQGNIFVGFSAFCFHDRILEVPLDPLYVSVETDVGKSEVIHYAISIRKKSDYQVTVSGHVQFRTLLSNGQYGYEVVRLYETIY